MRLPGRLAAAIEVLGEVEDRKRPVSEALKAWGLANRFAGAGDRSAVGNLVYDALRRRASHAYAMDEDSARALVLSVAVRDWGAAPAELAASFVGDKFAPAEMSDGELTRLISPNPLAGAPDHVLANMPEWVMGSVAAGLGRDAVAEGQGMAMRPPLDLRVNALKSDRSRVLKSLRRFDAVETAISPLGVRLAPGPADSRTPNVLTDEGYLKGWFEVQDEGSQIAAALANVTAGEQVLDLCAGAGGKTLALAAAMQNRGQIFAHDSDRARLAPIYDRLKRNGVRNVQVRPPGPGVLDDLEARIDCVLVDAPCTGSGTWRRRPDAKWRLTPAQLDLRAGEQRAILAQAVRFVRPGGRLVYITCSILAEENAMQVAAFLAGHPEFAIAPPALAWTAQFGAAIPVPRGGPEFGVALSPHSTQTDGFFIATLMRTG